MAQIQMSKMCLNILLSARLTVFPRFEVLLNQVSLRLSDIAGSRGFVLVLRDLRQQDCLRLAAGTEDVEARLTGRCSGDDDMRYHK